MNFKTLNDYKKEGMSPQTQTRTKTKKKRPAPTREAKAVEWPSSILTYMVSCKKQKKIQSKKYHIQKSGGVCQRRKKQKCKCC